MGNMLIRRILGVASTAAVAMALLPAAGQAQLFHGRKAWTLRNDKIDLVITLGGGHIASAALRSGRGANLNPLWAPPWRSTEPGGWMADPANRSVSLVSAE